MYCALAADAQRILTADVSFVGRPFPIEGSTLFTASGTQYFHLFNMSLCGGAQATCKNNVSYHDDGINRGVGVSRDDFWARFG